MSALGHKPAESRGGKQLMLAAREVLRESADPLHYREVAVRLRDRGIEARGADPSATLLTALTRDPAVRGLGRRSGIYTLACRTDDDIVFRRLTLATREADELFESGKTGGGGTRHWLRDCFLPALEEHGLVVTLAERRPEGPSTAPNPEAMRGGGVGGTDG